jgi:5-formyltetrahydrofolate cyclo-ligase
MTESPVFEQKTEMRKRLRAARGSLSTHERQKKDSAISQIIVRRARQLNARSIAAFWPFDGEPDLRPALALLDAGGVTIALPSLSRPKAAGLTFRVWHAGTPMTENRYGIPEPAEGRRQPLDELDVLLAPLVAWDRRGNRLGMGGGYYDRVLSPLAGARNPLTVGVAYCLQEQLRVPVDARDVPVQAIVNEDGWFIITSPDRTGRPMEYKTT